MLSQVLRADGYNRLCLLTAARSRDLFFTIFFYLLLLFVHFFLSVLT